MDYTNSRASNKMNVWVWGPSMWDILHASAFLADSRGVNVDGLVRPLTQLLPCVYCRNSFAGFYASLGHPRAGHGGTWTFEAHRLVNAKLANQRVDKFIEKHGLSGSAAAALKAYSPELYSEPTMEILQKRFMVHRDEPLPWRSLSTALLAIVMGLQLQTSPEAFGQPGPDKQWGPTGPMAAQYEALATFIGALRQIIKLSCQANAKALQSFLGRLVRSMPKGPSAMRSLIESAKYAAVCGPSGPLERPSEATKYIKAGVCMAGTCV